MTAQATALHHDTRRPSPLRTALILVAACAVAVALNAGVAALAVQAGADPTFGPLTAPAYTTFTIVGIVIGWLGWRIIERHAAQPRRVLAILVPVVLVLSFVPDLLLMTLQFIPGTTVGAVVALMAMHVVVVAVAVPAYVLMSSRASAGAAAE